jgi:hypothetical protein
MIVICICNSSGRILLSIYDKKMGIDWKWQAMDGVITKAPLGGKMYRSKSIY